jgi:hypothetical protein
MQFSEHQLVPHKEISSRYSPPVAPIENTIKKQYLLREKDDTFRNFCPKLVLKKVMKNLQNLLFPQRKKTNRESTSGKKEKNKKPKWKKQKNTSFPCIFISCLFTSLFFCELQIRWILMHNL